MISKRRLPILVMTQPEKGRENIKPTGSADNTPPKAANDKPRCCWILAIREAQLAKHNPAIKNMAPTAMRNASLDWVTGAVVVSILSAKCKKYTKSV